MSKHIVWTQPSNGLVAITYVFPAYIAQLRAGGIKPSEAEKLLSCYEPGPLHDDLLAKLIGNGLTRAEAMVVAQQRSLPADAITPTIVAEADLPKDSTFSRAWRQKADGLVEVDMVKARVIKMDLIRAERNLRLDEMDKEFSKALSTGADTAAIAAKMQTLRDIPQTTDLSDVRSAEDLKTFEPEWPK
jgi:hypothetical protein